MIFISYRSTENDKALFIRHLCEANGIQCWKAPEDIRPGKDYCESIPEAIGNCSTLVVVLTKEAQKSDNILSEIIDAQNKKKRVIPLLMDNTPLNQKFNFALNHTQFITVNDQSKTAYEALIRELWAIENITPRKDIIMPLYPMHSNRKAITIVIAAALLIIIALTAVFFAYEYSHQLHFEYKSGEITVSWPNDTSVSEWEIRCNNSIDYQAANHTTSNWLISGSGPFTFSVYPKLESERNSHNVYIDVVSTSVPSTYSGKTIKIDQFELKWHDQSGAEEPIPLQAQQEIDQTKYRLHLHCSFSMPDATDGEKIVYGIVLHTPFGLLLDKIYSTTVQNGLFGTETFALNDFTHSSDFKGKYELQLFINGVYWGSEFLTLE